MNGQQVLRPQIPNISAERPGGPIGQRGWAVLLLLNHSSGLREGENASSRLHLREQPRAVDNLCHSLQCGTLLAPTAEDLDDYLAMRST